MIPLPAITFARAWWKLAAGVVFGAILTAAPAYLLGQHAGAAHQKDRAAAANAIAVQGAMNTDATSKEVAAGERLADEKAVTDLTEKLTDAVAAIPDATPDAVAVGLGCQRLRNAGTDVSGLPVCR